METLKRKRVRAVNFSDEEEQLLLKCVLKRKHIIECKKTDALSSKERQIAWTAVEQDYNATCLHAPRSLKTLREKYTNIKGILRKKIASEKLERMATGGGKYARDDVAKTDDINQLIEVIGKSVHGDPEDCFDDECYEIEYLEPVVSHSPNINNDCDLQNETTKDRENQQQEKNDWSQHTPSMLKKKPKKVLQIQKRENANLANENISLKKRILQQEIELNELKKTHLSQLIENDKELHTLRIQISKNKNWKSSEHADDDPLFKQYLQMSP